MTDIAATTVPVSSPDGRFFVFGGTNEEGATSLWIRPLDSSEATPLPGTAGGQEPIWSPDGRWIGFYADGKLKKVSTTGGQPQTIAALPGLQDAAWGAHGDIIFRPSNRQPLFRISESGGTPTQLTQLNAALAENSHRAPSFLPDGRRFLFTSRCAAPENNALYLGSLDSPDVRRVMPIASKAIYVPAPNGGPGSLLYYREGNLEARAFDPDGETLVGDPQLVIDGVDYNAASIAAFFEASREGRVIVVRPAGAGNTQLTWFDRNGEQTGTLGAPGNFLQPRISPRGDRVSFTRPDDKTGNRDVWTIEVARGIAAPLTVNPANDWHGVWAPDATRMVFDSDRGGGPEGALYIKKSIDAGAEESLLVDAPMGGPTDWSRDGRWIAYGPLQIASAPGDRPPFRFLATPFRNGAGRFSPDGKWLAYTSDETGRFEVFVRPFAGAPAAAGGKIQLSASGGDFPSGGRTDRSSTSCRAISRFTPCRRAISNRWTRYRRRSDSFDRVLGRCRKANRCAERGTHTRSTRSTASASWSTVPRTRRGSLWC
jgi:Tol biopolymer transport system component